MLLIDYRRGIASSPVRTGTPSSSGFEIRDRRRICEKINTLRHPGLEVAKAAGHEEMTASRLTKSFRASRPATPAPDVAPPAPGLAAKCPAPMA